MDVASLIGLIGAVGMIVGSMISSGGILPFLDLPSVLIVFGGTFFSVMYLLPMNTFLSHFRGMLKVFKPSIFKTPDLIERMVELSNIARKEGMMALEGQVVADKFFESGLQMLVDGADEVKIAKQLKHEIRSMKRRHADVHAGIKAWVDIGPAMGMIGTLIGLVLMLGNMSDPKAIGPAMAVALLTTLYGAIMANVLFGPMLAKLEHYSADEVIYRELVIDGLCAIAKGESGRNIQDQLLTALGPKEQQKLAKAA